jgi:hypothetical protein
LPNGETFDTLLEKKAVMENWRREYNQIQPLSSLEYRPPALEAVPVTEAQEQYEEMAKELKDLGGSSPY